MLEQLRNSLTNMAQFIDKVKRYGDATELTPEFLRLFIPPSALPAETVTAVSLQCEVLLFQPAEVGRDRLGGGAPQGVVLEGPAVPSHGDDALPCAEHRPLVQLGAPLAVSTARLHLLLKQHIPFPATLSFSPVYNNSVQFSTGISLGELFRRPP